MQEALKIMEELLNSLLDISKLEAGVITPKTKNFSTVTLFQHLFTQFDVVSKELGVNVRLHPCNATLHTDPVLLARIIQNFVLNAVRHTRSGKVLVGCRKAGNYRRIEVWDQGPGIPGDQLDVIFEEFHQIGEPTRNRQQGLGLGLAIAKKMSILLNLQIKVRSVPDKGSVFSVQVPLGSSAALETDVDNSPVGQVPGPMRGHTLVVEDNPTVLKATVHLLQLWGYEVITASNAKDALDIISRVDRVPFMAVLDYRLPGEWNGVQLYDEICRVLGRELPSILITGDSSVKRLRDVEACGLPLLHKPIDTNQLHRLILTMGDERNKTNKTSS